MALERERERERESTPKYSGQTNKFTIRLKLDFGVAKKLRCVFWTFLNFEMHACLCRWKWFTNNLLPTISGPPFCSPPTSHPTTSPHVRSHCLKVGMKLVWCFKGKAWWYCEISCLRNCWRVPGWGGMTPLRSAAYFSPENAESSGLRKKDSWLVKCDLYADQIVNQEICCNL